MMTSCQMSFFKRNLLQKGICILAWSLAALPVHALNLAQAPLSLTKDAPPLIMLTMARDHKLYYEAYNDYSDLDGDGTLDLFYKPSIEYYGYFDSYKCYNYSDGIFTPVTVTTNKKCTGDSDSYWSGDFLNYVTTARIDALRKVFYGGKRSTDSTTRTILERTFVPQDAHSWGKEYESITRDGYDIREYTPLSLPQTGYRHLFANVTLSSDTSPPLMRVLNDSAFRIWEWVSIEVPVAGTECATGANVRSNCATSGGSSWSIVPSSNSDGLSNLTMATYNTASADNPGTKAAFDTLETTYALASRLCGNASVASGTINGAGNPYTGTVTSSGITCSSDQYLSVFTGTLNIATAGKYTFGVDGDDAVDFFIDGVLVTSRYGSNSKSSSAQNAVEVTLSAGAHAIKFRHHEKAGDDNYYLYWKLTVPSSTITDYNVRVEVCKKINGIGADYYEGRESNCQAYGSSTIVYKPTGLLHKYGQDNGMYFGLITGSYDQNTNGGILRKEVGSITNEIEATTGVFKESGASCGTSGSTACAKGIVGTIDRLKITSFSYGSHQYSCGWITTRAMNDGECEMWGNPLAEMMYEGMRYFAGKSSATSKFTTSNSRDSALGLPRVTWSNSTDPYGTNKYPSCSKPYFMLISDVYPSFDSDSLPGTNSNFGTFSGDISGLDVSTLGGSIWNFEFGDGVAKDIFIGQVGDSYDGAPTVKAASSFGNIRGLAPGEPTRQGSYYAASLAYYARTHALNSKADAKKGRASTYSIALTTPLPKIEIPVDNQKVILVPFAKSVGGSSISATKGQFQPTDQIVDFYVDTIKNTTTRNADTSVNGGRPYYKFRINYEDVEQGADHDMDAIATYEIKLNADNTITISLSSDYAAGGIIQHMGYVVSGTTADGVYLEVRDKDTSAGSDPDYFLDTPNTTGVALPLSASRTFTVSSASSVATLLEDPLWYAAKYGGFTDKDNNTVSTKPEDQSTWDADGDGVPDNYFLVVNPLEMQAQLDKALSKIKSDTGASAALATSSFSFQSGTLLYQSLFDKGWAGQLNAYEIVKGDDGTLSLNPDVVWSAQKKLAQTSDSSRVILTYDPDKASNRGIPFKWGSMSTGGTAPTLQTALNKTADGTVDALGPDRVTFLRGGSVSGMRTRPTVSVTLSSGETTSTSSLPNKLGDIIHSQAQYVARPSMGYGDASYVVFSTAKKSRTPMIYVGANDGMLHGFSAATGEEKIAYVPSEMYRTRSGTQPLSKLTQNDYGDDGNPHRYYVDGTPTFGDICPGSCAEDGSDWKTILVGGLNAGGQGIYALDITNPINFSDSNAASIVKWEFLDHDHDGTDSESTISGDAELGYTFSRPLIVKLCTQRDTASTAAPKVCTSYGWYVMFGNGYNNTETDGYAGTGDAVLYVLHANTGYLAKKLALNVAGGSSDPNGLAEVAPIDVDGDGIVDYVYAGDLKGNLWRMDFVSDTPSGWGTTLGTSSVPAPLYIAQDQQTPAVRQPITTAPDAILHPQGGLLVIFGTGRYIAANDPTTTQVQSIYGIRDKLDGSTVTAGRTALQQQQLLTATVTSEGIVYKTITANTVNWAGKNGWYVDLPESGERIADNPAIAGTNVLMFSSTIPLSDICEGGGTSWDYYVDALTGGRLSWSPFVDLPGVQEFGETKAYGSARKSNIGITPSGTIVSDTKFQVGSKGELDQYRVNLNGATASRLSWKEILND